jgi:two-component system, NarL family, sensor histidine kinase UhpB
VTKIISKFPLGALLATLVLQLAYWLVLNPLLFVPAPAPDRLPVSQAMIAELQTPDRAGLALAEFRPVELPWDGCCESGYRAARMQFTVPTVPEDGLAIVPSLGSDNYRMYVNGSLLFGDGEMSLPNISYHGNIRTTFRIPPSMLHQGANQLDFILVRDAGTPYFSVGTPTIGDFATVKQAFTYRNYSLSSYLTMSQGIGFAAALLAFVLWLRSDRNPAIFWMAVLCAVWALRIMHHRSTYPAFHGEMRIILLYAWVSLLPVALLNFANQWTGSPHRWITRTSVVGYVINVMTVVAIIGWGLFDKIDTADRISMGFGLAAAATTVGLFVAHCTRKREPRILEVAVFVLCASLIGSDAIATLFDLHYGDHVKRALPVLLLGFVAPFFASNVRLFRSMSEFNELLSSQLAQRTVDLELAHARETELVRNQAHHQERQRIMRDMHDGLGSQLMSMLLAARRGKLEPQRMTEGIESVVDEMRLMIDSMDSVGESLGVALSTFHDRAQSRVEAAGVAFKWQEQSGGNYPDFGPRDVLQIFRILQESVNNALKHSTGKAISISVLAMVDAGFPLRISVDDDGSGLAESRHKGRGLDNMRTRAEAIGAKLTLLSGPGGCSVQLDLPTGAPASS